MCANRFARAGPKKKLIHLKKSKLVFFSPRFLEHNSLPNNNLKEWEELQSPTPPHILVQQESPRGSLMSNLCSGDISSPVSRSERARTSLIKHPDCLVLLYYHLSLPHCFSSETWGTESWQRINKFILVDWPRLWSHRRKNKGLKFSRAQCQVSLLGDSPELSRSSLTFPTQRPVTSSLCKPCKCCN